MIATENILHKARKYGIWVDYYTGKPRVCGYEHMTNNFRRLHGLPMKRRMK